MGTGKKVVVALSSGISRSDEHSNLINILISCNVFAEFMYLHIWYIWYAVRTRLVSSGKINICAETDQATEAFDLQLIAYMWKGCIHWNVSHKISIWPNYKNAIITGWRTVYRWMFPLLTFVVLLNHICRKIALFTAICCQYTRYSQAGYNLFDYSFVCDAHARPVACAALLDFFPFVWVFRRHEMETFSILLTRREGSPPVAGEFPSEGPSDVNLWYLFDASPNKHCGLLIPTLPVPETRHYRSPNSTLPAAAETCKQ